MRKILKKKRMGALKLYWCSGIVLGNEEHPTNSGEIRGGKGALGGSLGLGVPLWPPGGLRGSSEVTNPGEERT